MKSEHLSFIKILAFASLCFYSYSCTAQKTSKGRPDSVRYYQEIRIVVDNDVFTSLTRDSYYSSGIFGFYRHLVSTDNQRKVIRSYSINQRIYTPRSLRWQNVDRYDRPYAGHLSAFLGNEYYFKKNNYLRARVELGWMGPGSKTGDIQTNWHNFFGLPEPQGWQYQIQNSPIINLYGTYAHTWVAIKGFDIITESNVAFGSAFNFARQEIMLRVGRLYHLFKSVHFNGVLGELVPSVKQERAIEIYLFYSPGVEYNIYNTTIEGNILGKEAPHTEDPVRWIRQHKLGLNTSWPRFDWQIFFYARSQETTEAENHRYIGMHLNFRFGLKE